MNNCSPEKGKKDFWTLKYRDKYLHSKVDPVKEAKRSLPANLSSNIYIVFGLGLGYHIQALLDAIGDRDAHILVFEPEPDILDACNRYNPIGDSRIKVFAPDELNYFFNFFSQEIPSHSIQSPVFWELKSEKVIFEEVFSHLKKQIDEFFNYYFQSLFTEAEFAPLWLRNLIINSEDIFSPGLSIFLEGDAVLVSAGPSLEKSLDYLKKIYKKVPFFAVDTALRPLMEAGMVPDVIVASDSQIHNFQDFFHISELQQCILACDISVYYKIPELFDKKFFFRTQGVAEEFFNTLNSFENHSLPVFPPGGSVSAAALTLVYSLGAKRIIMAGQDLCYPHLTHSVGTVHYYRFLNQSNRFNTIWNSFEKVIRSRGYQDLFMQNLSTWMDDLIELKELSVFQMKPEFRLKNASTDFKNQNFNGSLHTFEKLPRKQLDKERRDFREAFLGLLLALRNTSNLEEFMNIREQDRMISQIFNKLFLKQDLYLKRKQGNPTLYLGGCFRIIDRIIRAVYYLENKISRK